MRRSLRSLLPALLFLLPIAAAAQSPKVTSVEKVADGIWMARTSAGSNASWFVVGEEVIAVDAGSDAETGRAVLEKIQETAHKPVRYLIVTHAHGDHGGGAGAFAAAGADVVCQENAAPALMPIVTPASRTKSGTLAFSERLALVGGSRRVVAYFLGPAHSSGDILVYLPDDKVLFPGDLVLATAGPYMQSPDVDPAGWESVLVRLSQLDVEKIVPGHGGIGARKAITETLAYVKNINDAARLLVRENTPENLIEARLRRPDSGLDPAGITPELLANVRAVMRVQKTKPAPTPAAKPHKKG